MGSQTFSVTVTVEKKTTDADAFTDARQNAAYDSGHGGYTGTIAEKDSFVMIHRAKSSAGAQRIVDAVMGHGLSDDPIYRQEVIDIADDKWGPAGAVRYPIDGKTDGIIFFGWASS